MGPLLRCGGIVLDLEGLAAPLGIVGDGQLHRMQDSHRALRCAVQIVPEAALQFGKFNDVRALRDADHLAEIADGLCGVAAAAEAAERGHAGIVPAAHVPLFDQLAELSLAHHGVVDAEPRKFDLAGLVVRDGDVVHDPVVKRAVVLIFQGAERVRDALERVLDRMREVVHREDAPFRALAVMVDVADAVNDRIAHVEIAAGKVDLRAQGHLPFGDLAVLHLLEQRQVLLDRPVAVGRGRRDADVAAVRPELFRRQFADVGKSLFDQLDGKLIVLFKVIGAVVETVAPVEAEPVDVLHDGFHVFGIFLGRVGIVHAQVAQAAELLRHAEIDAQGLAVADVQIAVGLRRKTGVYGHAFILAALRNVLRDERVNEIAAAAFAAFVFRKHLFRLRGIRHQVLLFRHGAAPFSWIC